MATCLLVYTWQHFECIQLRYRWSSSKRSSAKFGAKSTASVEVDTLSAPDRVYSIAGKELGLTVPVVGQAPTGQRTATVLAQARPVFKTSALKKFDTKLAETRLTGSEPAKHFEIAGLSLGIGRSTMEQRSLRRRWLVVGVVALIWMAAVLFRLSYLQLVCYAEYFAKAQHQQRRVFEISPNAARFTIQGPGTAISIPMDSVFGDPHRHQRRPRCWTVARVLNIPAVEIETKIREAKTPVRLAKKLSPETVQRIDDMNLKGVFFQKENRRVYPEKESLAHVLGYADTDEKGIGGIEYAFDKQIRGKPGRMMVMADGKRRWYDRSEAAADPGGSVVLTVDETIQFIAEKELARGMEETHSTYGTVVIQNPNTGELLALANSPPFNPNDAGSYPDKVRMDRAVSAAYEPGSTFKVITMTGALENGVTNPDEMIDCQMGSILVAGRLIHDWHPFGILSVRDVLANSSDVGSIKVACVGRAEILRRNPLFRDRAAHGDRIAGREPRNIAARG